MRKKKKKKKKKKKSHIYDRRYQEARDYEW